MRSDHPYSYSFALLLYLLSITTLALPLAPTTSLRRVSFLYSTDLTVNLDEMDGMDASSNSTNDKSNDKSMLGGILLLEHLNINIPNHDIVKPFYLDLLGFGLDPRKAMNLSSSNTSHQNNKGTIWVNAGLSQIHLPHGDKPQVIPGSIGLTYKSLKGLKYRLLNLKHSFEFEISDENQTREYVKVCDGFGNVFFCREEVQCTDNVVELQQPVIRASDSVDQYDHEANTSDFIKSFGILSESTECLGIEYVEFNVPMGAAKFISEFYDCVLNSFASIISTPDGDIAIVGCGPVSSEGRAKQSIIYRETEESIPEYDGHHIAIYVDDFEEVFRNCEQSGVVWVNPRFSDKTTSISGARKWHQFRFKDILDLGTGKGVFKLEHEVRDPIAHEASLFK